MINRDVLACHECSCISFQSDNCYRGKTVLTVDGLELISGERIAVVGRRGCGKTTFLKLLAGLLQFNGKPILFSKHADTSQQIEFSSRVDSRLLRNIGIQIAYVPQQLGLWSHLTIRENITLPARQLLGVTAEQAERHCRQTLTELGLVDKINAKPSQLSGGEQQRVAVARAALCSPQLILLDEITSALDPTTAGEILGLLPRLFPQNATIVFVTHQYGFARQFASHIVYFMSGRYMAKVPKVAVDSGEADKGLLDLVSDSKRFYSW